MPEPTSSAAAAGGWAIGKALMAILGIGVVASALGFMVMLPKSAHEAIVRLLATMAGSALLGPVLCVALYWKYPGIFAAGTHIAMHMGVQHDAAPLVGLLMVCAPLLAMAGLPFWWILGAAVLWFTNRQGKDLGQLARDARADAGAVVAL